MFFGLLKSRMCISVLHFFVNHLPRWTSTRTEWSPRIALLSGDFNGLGKRAAPSKNPPYLSLSWIQQFKWTLKILKIDSQTESDLSFKHFQPGFSAPPHVNRWNQNLWLTNLPQEELFRASGSEDDHLELISFHDTNGDGKADLEKWSRMPWKKVHVSIAQMSGLQRERSCVTMECKKGADRTNEPMENHFNSPFYVEFVCNCGSRSRGNGRFSSSRGRVCPFHWLTGKL